MKKSNKKIKENPIMVNQKDVKGLKMKSDSGEQNEIKAFIIIIVIIAVLIGVIYGLTELFKDSESKNENEVVAGTINYDMASVGMLLNRPYDEYYVILYDSNDSKAVVYSTLLTGYMQNSESENYLKIYFTDLGNSLNSKYYDKNKDGKSNPSAKSIEDFNFGDLTLLKIKNGKITQYIEEYNSIKEILK